MEDAQPNEVRLSRKGTANVPHVRVTRPPRPRKAPAHGHTEVPRWIKDQRSRARGYAPPAPHLRSTRRVEGSDLAQNRIPGPSTPCPGPGGHPQYLGRGLTTSSAEPSSTRIRSQPVQVPHTNPLPRRRAAVHTVPPAESVIDLTTDRPGPNADAEEHSARWSTFRSGFVDVILPSSGSGSRSPFHGTSTNLRSSYSKRRTRAVGQREEVRVSPHATHSNVRVNDAVPTHSVEGHTPFSDRNPGQSISPPSDPRGYAATREDMEMLSLPPIVPSLTSACDNLQLSLGPHDKPRRILHDHDFTCIITAHGIIDQVDATSVLELDRRVHSPSLPFEESVDDACILSDQADPIIILGHAREQNQVTLLSCGPGQAPRRISLPRDWNPAERPGVGAVTALMSPLKFASGGYDHRVHVWEIAQSLSGASAIELAIKHNSHIHSLLPIVDTSHKLVSVGADCNIFIYDLSAERVVQTLKSSCIPHHAHKTDSPSCILLEVAHLETQFEVRDHRLPNQAVQRFGFVAEEKRGRFEKADSWSHFVVCGDKNGTIRLWDLRNVSTEVDLRQCFSDPIVQVINADSRLIACSKRNELACINIHG